MYYLRDRNFVLGLGVGIIIATLLMVLPLNRNLSKVKIETLARDMGMIYPNEVKAFFDKENK